MNVQQHAIAPDLSGISYLGGSPTMSAALVDAIRRLPREVALFAIERCAFLSVGAAWGVTLPGRIGVDAKTRRSSNMWIIALDDNMPASEMAGAIAHEIAHAWLKHDRLGDPPATCETDAAILAKSWGSREWAQIRSIAKDIAARIDSAFAPPRCGVLTPRHCGYATSQRPVIIAA